MANEPPVGLRSRLLASFAASPINDPDFFGDVQGPNAWAWRPMLFGLAFFHSVVQERRAYSSIGWNSE